AVRYGYSNLGLHEPFFHKLVPVLAQQFEGVFPELYQQRDFVENVILEEEKSFLRTLEAGLKRLDHITQQLQTEGKTIIAGEEAFELSDTFGFPLDLTALIAREKGFTIDQEGFEKALAEQKKRSRMDAAKEATDWIEVRDSEATDFVGYDNSESVSQILKFRKVKTKTGSEYHIVLDRTPFYAEMGGQVGDQGTLLLAGGPGDGQTIRIIDTKKENDLFIHISQDTLNEEYLKGA